MIKLIPLVILLAGCASSPYFEAGLGYKLSQESDWFLRTENGGGRNPTARFELGLEWNKGYKCGLEHWSHYFDGGPFNRRPETYKNEIFCSKKWGGK